MGTACIATGGGQSSSIPQLPDDIILRIFELLREDAQDFTNWSEIASGANSYLRVNRRFYSLLRSSWFSALFDTRSKGNARFAKVIQQPLILTWIREVSITFESDSPPYEEFANLGRLLNLRKLTASFQYRRRNDETIDVEQMLRPLANLPKLVYLSLSSTSKTSFRLGIKKTNSLYTVFEACPVSLRRLHLSIDAPLANREWRAIPWRHIEEIPVFSSTCTLQPKRGLYDTLENALYLTAPHDEFSSPRHIPLETLKLGFAVVSKSDEVFDLEDLHDLLELLKPTTLKTLELTLRGEDDPHWGVPIVLPSLEKLTLDGLFSLHDEPTFRAVRRIICSFPYLRVVHLRSFQISESPPTPNTMMALSKGELAFTWPELGAILLYLEEDTQVLEVIYQDCGAHEWMNWHRVQRTEPFQKDSYRYNFN